MNTSTWQFDMDGPTIKDQALDLSDSGGQAINTMNQFFFFFIWYLCHVPWWHHSSGLFPNNGEHHITGHPSHKGQLLSPSTWTRWQRPGVGRYKTHVSLTEGWPQLDGRSKGNTGSVWWKYLEDPLPIYFDHTMKIWPLPSSKPQSWLSLIYTPLPEAYLSELDWEHLILLVTEIKGKTCIMGIYFQPWLHSPWTSFITLISVLITMGHFIFPTPDILLHITSIVMSVLDMQPLLVHSFFFPFYFSCKTASFLFHPWTVSIFSTAPEFQGGRFGLRF